MDEFEDQLRRYRPAGPPPDLRDRIASAARGRGQDSQPFTAARRMQRWLPVAAAALVAVVFSMLAGGVRREVGEQIARGALSREAVVNEIAASLGDDPSAREEAERLVQLDELRARTEPREVRAGEGEVNNRD